MLDEWRKCSICKRPINHTETYQKCSVSSCRKSVYCSVKCWDVHVPVLNHKNAWAEEEKAPQKGSEERPKRRIVVTPKNNEHSSSNNSNVPKDILIVVSKLKAYVKARADMNTSADVSDVLSDIVRRSVDDALGNARHDGRKTLMGKDFR